MRTGLLLPVFLLMPGCVTLVSFEVPEEGALQCFDGIDNDADSLTDCEEEVCGELLECQPENVVPEAGGDALSMSEDSVLRLPIEQLLANDFDPEGEELRVVEVGSDEALAVSLEEGQLELRPSPDFHGEVVFSYQITDGAGVAEGLVTVTIEAVNDAPEAGAAFFQASGPELSIPVAALLAAASDVDGDVLTLSGLTEGQGGQVRREGAQIVFTSSEGFVGNAVFFYEVSDGAEVAKGPCTVVVAP